jgi:hypothetical protein
MTSSFSVNKGLEEPASGDYVNAWATPVNANWTVIDTALGGTTTISVTGISAPTTALTLVQYRPPNIEFTGTLATNLNYQIPTGVGGTWSINNATTGAFVLTFSIATGNSLTLSAGRTLIISDGVTVALAGTLSATSVGAVLYPETAAESAASVVPTNISIPSLDPARYGVVGDGVTDDTAAWARWLSVINQITTPGPLHSYGIRAEPTSFGGYPKNLQNVVLGDLSNTAFGYLSQQFTSGSGGTPVLGNCSYGAETLTANVTGQFCTAIGTLNQNFATGAGFNTSVGYGCMYNLLIGTSNVGMGFECLHDNQNGSANCVYGYAAQHVGLANGGTRDVNQVTVVGTFAGELNFADNITAIGYSALKNNKGNGNLGVGFQAGLNITTGTQNVCVGDTAGGSMTTGSNSTIVGFQAGLNLTTTPGFNTYLGSLAGFWNTTATQNVAVGYNALGGTNGANGSGGNTAVGYGAMQLCQNPGNCTGLGQISLRNVTTGASNTAVGNASLANVTSGGNNTGVGDTCGSTLTTGGNNTVIGKDTAVSAGTATNQTSLGFAAACIADNQITLGNSSVTALRCQVTTITAISDARFKADIAELDVPDGFLDEVQIAIYHWTDPTMPSGWQVGVIAQQLDELQTRYGVEWLGLVDKTNPDRWEATPGKLLFLVVQRVQRQEARLKRIESKLWGTE